MSRKKRPTQIDNFGESVLIPYHIGIVAEATQLIEKARKDAGPEVPTRITTEDL